MRVTNLNRTQTLSFRMNGATVTARFPDAGLAERLGGVYPCVRADTEDGRDPDIVVRRTARGYELSRARVTEACRSIGELLPVFEWTLTLALLERVSGCVHLHASGVVAHGRALLALGATGGGKSTLAMHWSRRGAAVLGDDTVLLDAGGRAHAFRRLFKLDPGAVTRAGIPLGSTPWWEPGSDEAWYDPEAGGGWADPAPVAVVALVARAGGASERMAPLARAAGLAALLQSCQSTGRTGAEAMDVVSRVAATARIVTCTYQESDTAAATLLELLA